MIIMSSSSLVVDNLIHSLSLAFLVKDLGSHSYFLSIELNYLPYGVFPNQRKYSTNLLAKTSMTNAKPISLPVVLSPPLSKFDSPAFDNVTLFYNMDWQTSIFVSSSSRYLIFCEQSFPIHT